MLLYWVEEFDIFQCLEYRTDFPLEEVVLEMMSSSEEFTVSNFLKFDVSAGQNTHPFSFGCSGSSRSNFHWIASKLCSPSAQLDI